MHESGSTPPRNPDAVRKKHIQDPDSDDNSSDIENHALLRTERLRHPVGRRSLQLRKIGSLTTNSASSSEPPALTDSEYDSESDDESHNKAQVFKEEQWFVNRFGMMGDNKTKTVQYKKVQSKMI